MVGSVRCDGMKVLDQTRIICSASIRKGLQKFKLMSTMISKTDPRPLPHILGKVPIAHLYSPFHLRPYRDEPSASRPIRADKHRRGQRVLTWVTSREHCAAAGIFFALFLDFFIIKRPCTP